jgi:hypothetical protein
LACVWPVLLLPIEKALAQHALPDHPGRAEENDVHPEF